MFIARTSPISGKVHTMNIDVTNEELNKYFDGDAYIQDVLGHLSLDEREFIKTGITPAEWDHMASLHDEELVRSDETEQFRSADEEDPNR